MRVITLLSLAAGLASSKTLNYAVPSTLEAVACTYPAAYEVANFTMSTEGSNGTISSISFHFTDADTGIDTQCGRNSTSKPSSLGANRWPCDDANVSFIYQMTWITGLNMIEVACPGNTRPRSDAEAIPLMADDEYSVPQFEASGLITPDLTCTNSTSGSTCVAKQSPIAGEFESLEPSPRPPSR
ncbi:hypothetical protein AAE478_000954 [Parahypoxylon ruwenzoriense]